MTGVEVGVGVGVLGIGVGHRAALAGMVFGVRTPPTKLSVSLPKFDTTPPGATIDDWLTVIGPIATSCAVQSCGNGVVMVNSTVLPPGGNVMSQSTGADLGRPVHVAGAATAVT